MELEYAKISEGLEKIEGVEQKRLTLDASEALALQILIQSYDYEKAVKEIGTIEVLVNEKEQAAKPQMQIPMIKMNVEAPLQTAGEIKQKIQGAQIQKRFLSANKEMIGAAFEIGRIVGGAGKELEGKLEEQIYKIKTSKLVLPTLSLQDQIQELEGIQEGLDNKAFDSEQLGIIKQEILGLDQMVKRRSASATGQEQDLLNLRARLVVEIRNKLLNSNN